MAGNSWKWLETGGNGWKLVEMAGMEESAGIVCTWLNTNGMAGKVWNSWKRLKIAIHEMKI